MNILHIVASVSKLNYGVWHAAEIGAAYLNKEHGVYSELIVCSRTESDIEPTIPFQYLTDSENKLERIKQILQSFPSSSTLIVTHGAWGLPTRLGNLATSLGFKWMYVPQGMLEPWAFSQKWLQKKIYFFLYEKRSVKKAARIRAVSDNELTNLKKILGGKFCKIYNGVNPSSIKPDKRTDKTIYLFLARLHYKKGILMLVKAWSQVMAKNDSCILSIVGPDDGELAKLKPYLKGNIEYLGALYGQEKSLTLAASHYYILPSRSEGFPSSVIEAMSYGAVPIVTDGCNTPFIFEEDLGYRIEPSVKSIEERFSQLIKTTYDRSMGERNIKFVKDNFSDEIIGQNLFLEYKAMLDERI